MNTAADALPDENAMRFVAVLNGKVELGRLLNALGHMTAGLISIIRDKEALCFLDYRDRDGGLHPGISHYPFIVLKAENSNQLRRLRAEALALGIPTTDFVQSMIVGSSAEQLRATSELSDAEHEYFGVCLFGSTEALRPLTKRFSLFR